MLHVYVVRKPFRNYGEVIVAGSLIDDPATIKHFKSFLAERRIIEVDEHTLDAYEEYFKVKYGVSIKEKLAEAAKDAKVAEDAKAAKDAKAAEEAKEVKVAEEVKTVKVAAKPANVAKVK